MTNRRIIAHDFRVFAHLDWAPQGVCLLVGPNGTGKTTILDAQDFLRTLFEAGHEEAFGEAGAAAFRRVGVASSVPVVLELQVGDVRWKLRFPMEGSRLQSTYGEELYLGEELVLRLAMFQQEWFLRGTKLTLADGRCCAKLLWDREAPPWMKPFVDALTESQVFGDFDLAKLRAWQPIGPRPRRLRRDGSNLWSVLASWHAAPTRFGDRFDWVMGAARRAFPGLLSSIEFVDGFPSLYLPHSTDPDGGLPPARAASGLLTCLVQLSAVAAASPGSFLAFDEPENHLHPHAIRTLISCMRERADQNDLTVAITTHSPVVMNEFRDHDDAVFVLDPDPRNRKASLPRPLLELHDEEWLAQAKLGTLYDRLAFASPLSRTPAAETGASGDGGRE